MTAPITGLAVEVSGRACHTRGMNERAALITKFYEVFARRDWAAMGDCYHPDVHFTDPVFDLRGDQARLMWRMLCTRGRDLTLEFRDVRAEGERGSAHWDARYTFRDGAPGVEPHRRRLYLP
jgi:hypothetical protein